MIVSLKYSVFLGEVQMKPGYQNATISRSLYLCVSLVSRGLYAALFDLWLCDQKPCIVIELIGLMCGCF